MKTETIDLRTIGADAPAPVASINGVALHRRSETVAPETLRQRACTELLRQAAIRDGLLERADQPSADGIVSEAAALAIDAWLQANITLPEPSDEACRRHHAARSAHFRSGEQVRLRHILFAVTPGVDVAALRRRAESCLLDVRCPDAAAAADGFAAAARILSNCPSGEHGGEIGWLESTDCAPEFAREVFGRIEVGVLPRLLHSRHGLHVVEVLERRGGEQQAYEDVRGAVVMEMRQQAWITALRHTMQVLAGQARIVGVELETADSPLVQ